MQTQGSLHDGGLAPLLQSMQAERATGTLAIDNDGDVCSLYFLFGHLFHASGAGGQGEEVVIDALGWDAGSYQFDPRAKLPAEETIKASPAELIAAAESRRSPSGATPGASTWPDVPPPAGDDGGEPAEEAPDLAATIADPAEEPAPEPDAPAASAAQTPEEPEAAPGAPEAAAAAPSAPRPEGGAVASTVGGASGAGPSSTRPYPLPGGKAQYEGLKSAFVDFPRLLRTLRSDRHTGSVKLTGSGYTGVLLFNEGQVLEALCSNGSSVQGETAFLQIRRHMDAGDGVLDVIELPGETVVALAQLFTAPHMYRGLLGRFVNLDALLEYLSEEKVSGSVVVQTPDEAGVILLRDGAVLGAYTESQRSLEAATAKVGALATDRQSSIEVKGGGGAIPPIDVDAALNRAY